MSKATLKLRHKIVKVLAPKLYRDWQAYSGHDSLEIERPMISFLKHHFGDKPLVGCEIGVKEGVNALRILKTLNIKKLFLVDPYVPYSEPLFPVNASLVYQDRMKDEARRFLKDYADRTAWVYETSDHAVYGLPKLDFCYIDGDHSYEYVKRDIINYWALIRKGGVLGGHDFTTSYFGLCKAVLDCFSWRSLQGSGYDWWTVKKEGK